MIAIIAALGACAIMQCLFATTYMSAGHAPKATDLPFGAVGSSPVLTAAEKTISLKVTTYPNEQAAKTAIDQAQIWGALIPSGTSDTLIVVPSISDLAPLDLAVRFQDAAALVERRRYFAALTESLRARLGHMSTGHHMKR